MRTKSLFAFALFVSSCDYSSPRFDCKDGESIGFSDDGTPVCQSLGKNGDQVPLPGCGQEEALTVDGQGVHCVPRANVPLIPLGEQLAELNAWTARLARDLSALAPPFPKFGVYVGTPTVFFGDTRGRIVHASGDVGVAAAAKACVDSYGPGSHFCSVYEFHRSVSLGVINDTTSFPRSWIYFPAWNAIPTINAQDKERGLGDTCDGFIAGDSRYGYRGTTVEWKVLSTGLRGLSFKGGNDSNCTTLLPIVCCR